MTSYYAASPDRIATTPIAEGIEITAGQYADALAMMIDPSDDRVISIEGGIFALVARPEPEPDPEPQEPDYPALTPRQLRLGLIAAGISLASVDAAIDGIEDASARDVARVEWEYASVFERSHPLIDQTGAALSLSPSQIDAMWRAAAVL